MRRKRSPRSAFFRLRALIALLLCALACFIAVGTVLAFLHPEARTKVTHPAVAGLTFAERVSYQRVIEEVYWRHRIWPKERPDPKPSLDAVMFQAQLEKKVADYLRDPQALKHSQRLIMADQLQAEMDRMAQHTKQPEMLRELFEALGNDPFVIAECLARPILADRLRASTAVVAGVSPAQRNSFAASTAASTGNRIGVTTNVDNARYKLPQISAPLDCGDDTWAATAAPPEIRESHTGVWTGSEMIVWGGIPGEGRCLNTGGKYNPATDTWTATSTTAAPEARLHHTAVWTGSEMIVWGGADSPDSPDTQYFNTGARYNPITDNWTATNITDAPAGRAHHTVVWTGSEMIVWGGQGSNTLFNNGGRYNPSTDSWTATSTTSAPTPRVFHSAVWTGSEMIVWGGTNAASGFFTGGRYNPNTDSWTATSDFNAPEGRYDHTAVWTGSEMIIFGGHTLVCTAFGNGKRYDPGTDSWTAISTINAPDARFYHTAVWTGSEIIVWGGQQCPPVPTFNTGGRYNPLTDSWTATTVINAPAGRESHTVVWTGSEMIIWGGFGIGGDMNTGVRYNLATDSWTNTGSNNAPSGRETRTAVWTGSEMIIWGGGNRNGGLNTGGRYNPALDSWTPTSTTNAPEARGSQSSVWTGSELIIWGGFTSAGQFLNTGGRYNPITDSWTPTSTSNAPAARADHSAIWTGGEMIIWGGIGCGGNCNLITGGRYDPSSDGWMGTTTTNAPSARWDHTAVWTGSEMIVWGGTDAIPNHTYLHTGGRYSPANDSWMPTSVLKGKKGGHEYVCVCHDKSK